MANLKIDLVNKVSNDKYYEELELIRLASDPNMNYKEKIDSMSYRLREIALLDAQLGLIESYFQEPAKGNQQQVQQTESQQHHQGQSHGE